MISKRLVTQFKPSHYLVKLDLTQAKSRIFSGEVHLQGKQLSDKGFSLHSKNLNISSIHIDGVPVEYHTIEGDILYIHHKHSGDPVSVYIKYSAVISEPMHGLYPSYFNIGNQQKEIYSTQLESHYAREVFPCIDEPSAKAIFEVVLKTDKEATVLSNTEIKIERPEGKYKITEFSKTPLMSTYLLAIAVGELISLSDKSNSDIKVTVYASKSHNTSDLKFALETSVKLLNFYESYFKVKYPLKKLDHLAIPDFSAGAMENWGLITYREEALIISDDSTIEDKREVAKVIAHELAHQWFGNLVTMKWWNDLWLNESFATFIEYVAVDNVFPDWEIWSDFSSHEVVYSLQRDCYDKVQPVRVDVDDPGEIGALFDGAIVYAKGARLIKMLLGYVGEDVFRESLKLYFEKFEYSNTDSDDLWDVISKISGKDIKSLMHPWLVQPGYPLIKASSKSVSQSRFLLGESEKDNTLWPVFLESDNPEVPNILDKKKLVFQTQIEKYSLNINDSSHFITLYDNAKYRYMLREVSSNDFSLIRKLQFIHEQLLLAKGGYLEYFKLLDLLYAIKEQENYLIWNNASIIIADIYKIIADDENHIKLMDKFIRRIVDVQLKRIGIHDRDNESANDKQLRQVILLLLARVNDLEFFKASETVYRKHKPEEINPETRAAMLISIVKNMKDNSILNELVQIYTTTNSPSLKSDLIPAITAAPTINFSEEILGKIKNEKFVKPQDLLSWLASYLSKSKTRKITWEWIQLNWSFIENTYKGDNNLDFFPKVLARNLITKDEIIQYNKFFKPLSNDKLLTRAISVGKIELKFRYDIAKKERDKIFEYLKNFQPLF